MTQRQAKTDQTMASGPEAMTQAAGLFALTPMLAPQFERFWKAQEDMLTEAEIFSRGWFERRHQATKTALETTRDIADTGALDSSSALLAIAEWQRGSFERIFEDIQEWMKLCARYPGDLVATETTTGEERPEKTGQRKSRADKREHATAL